MTDTAPLDVLAIGALAVDDLLYVDAYPPAESKVRVRRRERQCGGLAGTALVAAARLGACVAYIGSIGQDESSRLVAEQFSREGIDLAHAVVRPDAKPYHSTIIVSLADGSRTIFASAEGHSGADPERPSADVLRRARVLLVDHHHVAGTRRAARIVRAAGGAVVADFEREPDEGFGDLLAWVDHLVLPERFARQLSGAPTARAAAEALLGPAQAAVVVTCGSAGCWHVAAGRSPRARHCPAFAVEVVDTTGCGDVFHGAYCAALAQGQTMEDRVRWASAAAALAATAHGGQAGVPRRADVERFLAAGPPVTP